MRKKRIRLWIEGIRITSTGPNRLVADTMKEWKSRRERPKHFTQAVRLYLALLDGDIDKFYELLMEFLPKVAFQMMKAPIAISTNGNGHTPKPKVYAPTFIDETAEIGENAVDEFLSGLGLDNNF